MLLGCLVVRASDLRLNGREFDHQPPHYWSVDNQPPRPTQPPTLSETRNEYQSKCSDALWLAVIVEWLTIFVNKRVGGR